MSGATSPPSGSPGAHSPGTAGATTVVSMDPQERHRAMTSLVRTITGGTVAAAVATTAVLTVTLSAQADDTATSTGTGSTQDGGVATDGNSTSSGGDSLTSSTAPTPTTARQGHARSGGS